MADFDNLLDGLMSSNKYVPKLQSEVIHVSVQMICLYYMSRKWFKLFVKK